MIAETYASFGLEEELGSLDQLHSRWEAPNEINYLDGLQTLNARGGVYLGVATEPVNFTYIAKVQPEMAIFVDINPVIARIHLPLKGALLEIAESRIEFLSMVLGRPLAGRSIPDLKTPQDFYNFFNGIPYSRDFRAAVWERISGQLDVEVRQEAQQLWMNNFGLELSDGFSSQDVLLGKYIYWNMGVKDTAGKHTAWLAAENDFVYIRDMWREGRIKGLTGDIAGSVMKNLSKLIRQMGKEVSCMYVSNCEDPLEIHGGLNNFRRALMSLPWQYGSQVIRYDFSNKEKNAFAIHRVGLGSFSEEAFGGRSEAVSPEHFSQIYF